MMPAPPERLPERDAAILAVLPRIADSGWTMAALRAALEAQGQDPLEADLLFPGGAADMVAVFIDLADREMAAIADLPGFRDQGMTRRVRALVAGRLAWLGPHRAAVRRAAALLALPCHAGLAATSLARTVDAIWALAGDTSTDFSRYSRRATLAAVYGATLLYWLRDHSEDATATLAFLDRRLAGVGRIGRLRARAAGWLRPTAGAGAAG